ncbi:hypothetical protein BU198_12995 [Streptomyces sp. CBMA156]|nr:hypothetical protein [Streptomyces sp. CBMA156]
MFQKESPTPGNLRPGMSTYLALTFGTLLSSQGTDASFGLPSSRPSGLRSFVFPAYQTLSAPFTGAFRIRNLVLTAKLRRLDQP